MQEINVAYTAIQLIISERDLLAADQDNGSLSDEESNSDCEAEFDTTKNKQSKKKYNKQKREYEEEEEFKRKVEEEMSRFKRAHQAANKKNDNRTNNNTPRREKGVPGKGTSKAAKKRAKIRNKRKMQQKQQEAMSCKGNGSSNNKKINVSNGTNNDEEEEVIFSTTAKEIPLHHFTPEERCEMKFNSKKLLKSPEFIAIRARTWTVLQILQYQECDLCDPIPLLEKGVIVTPLMVACYLGDGKAVDTIISLLEKRWSKAVLTVTNNGEDCYDLAREARSITLRQYEESKYKLDTMKKSDESTKKQVIEQEKIMKQYGEGVILINKLVERMENLKRFAIQRKMKSRIRWGLSLICIGIGIYFFPISTWIRNIGWIILSCIAVPVVDCFLRLPYIKSRLIRYLILLFGIYMAPRSLLLIVGWIAAVIISFVIISVDEIPDLLFWPGVIFFFFSCWKLGYSGYLLLVDSLGYIYAKAMNGMILLMCPSASQECISRRLGEGIHLVGGEEMTSTFTAEDEF